MDKNADNSLAHIIYLSNHCQKRSFVALEKSTVLKQGLPLYPSQPAAKEKAEFVTSQASSEPTKHKPVGRALRTNGALVKP